MSFTASIHAFTDFGPGDVVPFHEALRRIRAAGYEDVMLLGVPGGPCLEAGDRPAGSLLDYTASDPGAVADALEEAGLRLACMFGAYCDLSTDQAFDDTLAWLSLACDRASVLGCRFFGHSVGAATEPGMPTSAKEDRILRLAHLMDCLGERYPDLWISADVHAHGNVESVADCEFLLAHLNTPNTGPLLNIGHMTTCRQDGWTLLERYPDRLHFIAWKDHRVLPDEPFTVVSVELGTADSPFERYIPLAKAQANIPRINTIAIENTPLGEKAEAMRRSLEYISRLWDSS
jgi:sugar phosphate isomerase/epimerase